MLFTQNMPNLAENRPTKKGVNLTNKNVTKTLANLQTSLHIVLY